MAEQSMFWPTTGTGDGISGGYTSDRLGAIWNRLITSGKLEGLEITGTGTTSLAIASGAALVSGYLYENTSSATITTSTLGSATYGLYVIANESASALTVNRSVSGTSVAAKTVRLALNSTDPSQPYIKLATVITTAGTITSIVGTDDAVATINAATKKLDAAQLILDPGFGDSPISIPNNTVTALTGGGFSADGTYVTVDYTTGEFTVSQSGIYMVTCNITWDTNTTNRRRISVGNFDYQLAASSFIHTTMSKQFISIPLIIATPSSAFTIDVWQDSGATRTISQVLIEVVKL